MEVLPKSRLAPELSCCLQDSGGWRQPTRPLIRNALGRKLSCCLQDCRAGACDPESAALDGCAPPHPDVSHGIAANNPGCGIAISAGSPCRLADTPGQPRSSGGIIGAAFPLAIGLATHQLPRLKLRRLELVLTVAASPSLDHTGGGRTFGGAFRRGVI